MDRFYKKIDRKTSAPCWVWTAAKDKDGYGRFFSTAFASTKAHRIAYLLAHGDLPHGIELDHLCRNRTCVNPAHLEAVTHKENCRRGQVGPAARARQIAKTHCPQGHEYTPENTYIYAKRPDQRLCRACRKIRTQLYYRRNSCKN